MLKILRGFDHSQLLFIDHQFQGMIDARTDWKSITYSAIAKDGAALGSSKVYGVALQLIVPGNGVNQ